MYSSNYNIQEFFWDAFQIFCGVKKFALQWAANHGVLQQRNIYLGQSLWRLRL